MKLKTDENITFRHVYVIQDNDYHWYIIPYKMADDFQALLEREDQEIALEELEYRFSEYKTGGSINLVALYIKEVQ